MSSHRIIINTSATYIRSVIVVGLALFSSRWALGALGPSDYGLFAIVGSIIVCITFLNGVMAGSASRHFAFAIGRGDADEVNKWFNASLSIHLIFSVVLALIGWPIGEYCVRHVLTIPPDRINTCVWVFKLSLIMAFISMVSIPYVAMFSAKQHISELAVWGTFQSVLLFLFAYLLTKVSGDHLLFYGRYWVIISITINVILIIRARSLFHECRISPGQWFDRRRFKEILSFATWSLIGNTGAILRDQGSVILLNLYFGPKVNAAFGIANQVSIQTNQLANAMIGAFSPEITSSQGRGDTARMLSLAQRASKFGTILVLLFAIPIIVEMDYILKLWLIEPPVHTALFCQLILSMFILDRLSTGYMLAVNAVGRIAAYHATLGTILVLTLPIAWVFLKMGAPPTSISIAFVITMIAVSMGRVFWARRLLGIPVSRWLSAVALPSSTVAVAAISAVMVPRLLLSPSLSRLAITTIVGIMTIIVTCWFFAFDNDERRFINQNVRHLAIKIGIG